ncbi:MAG: glutathione S-transferase family protein [Alphaproteobacteria bacterium]|nr:glutathione S-transferase family protein [Alphaproteobacteria bacterium]
MLELYHNDMSVCAQKARFALAEKRLEWTGHHLNLRAGDQQKPDYLKINPLAIVPTLVHDGVVIPESTVICEYLDDAFPDPPLKSGSALERARMRLWTKQLDEGVHYATGNVSYCLVFRHQFMQKPPDELEAFFAAIPDPVRRARVRENVLKGMESSHFKDGIARYKRLVRDLGAALADGPWLAGQRFSLADIGFAPYITRLDQLGFQEWHQSYGTRIGHWYDRLRARPAYAEAITKWLNPPVVALLGEKGREAWPKVKAMLAA